ncbi:MAG TPA: hypothetical protein DCQ64_31435 [Candidatus Rokubacteria bacterium]|nr:hypothetical protein [Candidatus Rokubacteria bacterium]
MPLVDSHRLTDEDRAAWPALIRRYRQPAWKVDDRARLAQAAIRRFLAAGPAHVAVSWGKDSVTVAHLTRSVSPDVPMAWLRLTGIENPDCFSVRDAFLDRWPSNYVEFDDDSCAPDYPNLAPWARVVRAVGDTIGSRRVMGIRAAESGTRQISAAVHGVATNLSCRPILRWSTPEVFAYLLRHDLPIHPVYAMTHGGRLDMERLRVDFIGDVTGRDGGRLDWERHYYSDRLDRQLPMEGV